MATGVSQGSIQVVEFILSGEHFAIDLNDVKEVVEYTRITRLPNVHEYILGIIDLRGEITTIINLRQWLHIPTESTSARESARIIVLDEKIVKTKIGLLVDDVTSVSTYELNQVDFSTTTGTKGNATVKGIIRKKGAEKEKEANTLIIWLDLSQLTEEINTLL